MIALLCQVKETVIQSRFDLSMCVYMDTATVTCGLLRCFYFFKYSNVNIFYSTCLKSGFLIRLTSMSLETFKIIYAEI